MTRILTPVFLCMCAGVAFAEVQVEVRYGHGGESISGAITPIVVSITNREREPIELTAEARVHERFPGGEICRASAYLSAGASKDLLFHLRPPTLGGMGEEAPVHVDLEFSRQIRLVDAKRKDRPPGRKFRLQCVPADRPMGADEPENLQVLGVGRGAGLPDSLRDFVRVLRVDEPGLPIAWFSYDSVDAVLWRNPGEAQAIDPSRLRALLRWVHLGGRLVLVCTRRPDLFDGTALGEVLPASFGKPDPRADYRPIALELAGGPPAAGDGEWDRRGPYTRLLRIAGSVDRVFGEADEPLSVTARRGLGSVTVLAFDPAAFVGSKGLLAASVADLILGGQYIEEIAKARESDAYTFNPEWSERDYFSSLMTLLRSGALKPPPMLLLSLFMILYVLAVGPIDYFFLKKRGLLKYSALSFLILAVVFSATAYFVSFHLFAGGAKVNHVTFVDVVPDESGDGTEHVSIQDFAGFYAPRGFTASLAVEADAVALSQFSRPKDYSGWGGGGLASEPLRLDQTAPLSPTGEISVPFRSLRTLRTIAYRETVFPVAVLKTDGKFVVTNRLDYELTQAFLVNLSGFIALGDIPAGESVEKPERFTGFRSDVYGSPIERGDLPDAEKIDLKADAGDPSEAALSTVANQLMALSLATHFAEAGGTETGGGQLRLLRKWGIDRSESLERGATILIAYSTERDPFGLPGADGDGFTITVLRRVVDR